jgi:hypothetical protein
LYTAFAGLPDLSKALSFGQLGFCSIIFYVSYPLISSLETYPNDQFTLLFSSNIFFMSFQWYDFPDPGKVNGMMKMTFLPLILASFKLIYWITFLTSEDVTFCSSTGCENFFSSSSGFYDCFE